MNPKNLPNIYKFAEKYTGEMLLKLLVISLLLVLIAFLLIGINVIFLGRKFPETSVGGNKHMKKLGIRCVKCEERKMFQQAKAPFNLNPEELKIVRD